MAYGKKGGKGGGTIKSQKCDMKSKVTSAVKAAKSKQEGKK